MKSDRGDGIASPVATGGAGADFERDVGAYYLALLLLGDTAYGQRAGRVSEVRFQQRHAGDPLDDLVVASSLPARQAKLSLQIKHKVNITEGDRVFHAIIRECWTRFCSADFYLGIDQFGLVTAVYSRVVDEHYQRTLSWARNSTTATDFLDRINQSRLGHDDQRVFVQLIRSKLNNLGAMVNDETVWTFLRSLVLLRLDFHLDLSKDRHYIVNHLDHVLRASQRIDAAQLFLQLGQYAAELKRTAGSIDLDGLVRRLSNDGVSLAPPSPGFSRVLGKSAAPSVERASFEALLRTAPLQLRPGASNDHAAYVETYAFWQPDVDANPLLSDPDALESWGSAGFRNPVVSPAELVRHRRVLIVGGFNAGKSRLLERIVEEAQARELTSAMADADLFPVPILIRLREYHEAKEGFLAYVQRTFREASRARTTEVLPTEGVLCEGRYLFLIDGLDEIGGDRQVELLNRVRDFVSEYSRHAYVFTTRPGVEAASARFVEPEFDILRLVPFSKGQVRRYVALRGLGGTGFEENIFRRRDLLALARAPGNLRSLCDIAKGTGELPTRTGAIYETLITAVLEREAHRGTDVIPYRGLTRPVLNELAFTMTQAQRFSLPRQHLEDLVIQMASKLPVPAGFDMRSWIEEIVHRELLVFDGQEFTFPHRSWQEYLAACELCGWPLDDILSLVYVEREAASGFHPQWYQVLRFLAETRSDVLAAMYEREPVVAARCTPSDAANELRQRALETLFEAAAAQGTRMPGEYDTPRDVFNDRQTCVDLAPSGAVPYLLECYRTSQTTITREDAFQLLQLYAYSGNAAALEAVIALLPGLLQHDQESWGLREIASYAVARLDLPEFAPSLIALYDHEQHQQVRKAILWALANVAPQEARTIFVPLLMRRLAGRTHDTMGELALRTALPTVLDDEVITAIRERLITTPAEPIDLPDGLVDLLIERRSEASEEALLVLVTHWHALSLSVDERRAIYKALARDRVRSIRYVVAHATDNYVGGPQMVETLAALLDQASLEAFRADLMSPSQSAWVTNVLPEALRQSGKPLLAERLGWDRRVADAAEAGSHQVRQPTLGELLARPNWQTGPAFGLHGEAYAEQAKSLVPEQWRELRDHVTDTLERLDVVRTFVEDAEQRVSVNMASFAALIYAEVLDVDVSPAVYAKLLSINFEHASIDAMCERHYAPARDDEILRWVRADVPYACLKRAAVLCGRHHIRPLSCVRQIGQVLGALCTIGEATDHHRLISINALLSALSSYGKRGVQKLEALLGQVTGEWRVVLAQTRLTMQPPSVAAERIYLLHLIDRIATRDVHALWDRSLEHITTQDSVPLCFQLMQALLEIPAPDAAPESKTFGFVTFDDEILVLRAEALAVVARLVSPEVIDGFRRLMGEFPEQTWLSRYAEDARRLYLMQ